jgi:hypothetical protein
MPSTFVDVDPRMLHVPPSRLTGADPAKLVRQEQMFGSSVVGMPPPEATQGANGELMLNDGVTRATRVAKLLPGRLLRVQVTDNVPHWDMSKLPRIGDFVP